MHKGHVVFCLKLPLWIVLSITDQIEVITSFGIGGVQTEIRTQHLQSVSQKLYRLSHPAR